MRFDLLRIANIAIFVIGMASTNFAQNADGRSPITGPGDSRPQPIREMMYKMQLDREKKEFAEMLERGDKAIEILDEIESNLSSNASLSPKDRERLDELEKLTKRVLNGLGGDTENDPTVRPEEPADIVDGIKMLRERTVKLVDELKRISRYTTSVMAIETSNSMLRLIRVLKVFK